MNKKPALIIFLKYPAKGKVKTRLAADYDDEFAIRFYKLCVEKLINDIKLNLATAIDVFLFCSVVHEIPLFSKWLGKTFYFKTQTGNDLGERMQNAFDEIINDGYNKIIIIGTDIPDLNSKLLVKSFQLLNKYDIILGPSDDGGYYLLGLKKLHKEIFENIKWSSNSVFTETIKKVQKCHLSYFLTEVLIDIDNKEGLKKWLSWQNNTTDIPLVKFISDHLHGE